MSGVRVLITTRFCESMTQVIIEHVKDGSELGKKLGKRSRVSEQLVIAGFHRSGTSATAQLLQRAGLFLGYELLDALPSNPYGHFEDREIVRVHSQLLADNEQTWMVGEPLLPVIGAQRWQRMQGMIERRNSEHALWGFKDPRACLFLPAWKYLLPDMKVLIVYRHFSASTRSLGQRHSSDLFRGRGREVVHRRFWKEPDLALKMWLVHNKALLRFARAYPRDTLTVSIDMIRDGFPLCWVLNRRWRFGLKDVPTGEVFDSNVTAGRTTEKQPVSDRRLIGEVNATWKALEGLSRRAEKLLERGTTLVGE